MTRPVRLATSLALASLLAIPAAAGAAPRPLTLQEAVALAMRVDPLIAQAHIAEDRAENTVLRAQLDRVTLKVDASLRELWTKSNIGGAPQVFCSTPSGSLPTTDPALCAAAGGKIEELSTSAGQGLFNVSANVVAPLFTGFRITSNIKRAQLGRDATLVQLRQARKDLALTVSRAYWSVRRIGLLRDVLAQSLARLEEAEGVAAARVTAGLAPPVDRNRARLRKLQLVGQLAELAGQEREAVAQMGVILGVRTAVVGEDVVLVDPPSFPEAGPPGVEELLADALRGRPELETARIQKLIQDQVIRGVKSNWYPQLSLFGLLQFGNNPFLLGVGASAASTTANPFGNITGNLQLGAQLNINIFDTLNTWTALKDAEFERDRLLAEQRRVRRVVEADVRVAYAKLERLYGKRPPLVEARELARDNLAILEGRYRTGESPVIDYLDAQIALVDAEMQIADLTAQLQTAWIELEASLGRVVGEGA